MFDRSEFQPLLDAIERGVHSNSIIGTYFVLVTKLKQITCFLPENSQLRRRLWHVDHDTLEPPTCQACGKTVQWKNPTSTYNTFCSKKCAQHVRKDIPRSKVVINKIKGTKKRNPKQAWNKGVQRTQEQNAHLSETRRNKFKSGEITHWNMGNTTSEHVRNQIRSTALSQHRSYSQVSKSKRLQTYIWKKQQGWIHPSVFRRGLPNNLSQQGREAIRESSRKNNQGRKVLKYKRVEDHLQQCNIELVDIDAVGYLYTLKCNICNTVFCRTASVLVPYRYSYYNGKYCPTCFPADGGVIYSEAYFRNNPDECNKVGIFYLICLYSDTETFIKVGVTSKTVEQRWQQYTYYSIEPVLTAKTTLYAAFRLEQSILNQFKKEKYYPLHQFGGYTECLSEKVCDQIIEQIISKASM